MLIHAPEPTLASHIDNSVVDALGAEFRAARPARQVDPAINPILIGDGSETMNTRC